MSRADELIRQACLLVEHRKALGVQETPEELRVAHAFRLRRELRKFGDRLVTALPKSSPDWSCGIEVGQKIHAMMVDRGLSPPDLCEYDRTWPWGGIRGKPGTPECSRLGPNRMR